MVTVSLDGRFLKVNAAFCEMLGYSQAELLTKYVYEVTSPAFIEESRNMYEELQKQGPEFRVQENEYIRKDGTRLWVHVQASMVKDQNNQPAYFIVMVSDVSKQKEALEKLRQNEELISNTIANVSVVLFVIDMDGKFLLSEGKGLALLGLKPGEVVGRNYADVYAGHTVILEAVEKSSRGEFIQTKVVLGETIFDAYFSPYTDRQGKIMGTVGIAVDITEKERALQQLRESEEKYTSIFDTCPIPLTVSNFITGELINVNQEFLSEYGYTREEVIGRSAASLGIFAISDIRNSIIDTIERTGEVNHFELDTRVKNGDARVILFSAKKLSIWESGIFVIGKRQYHRTKTQRIGPIHFTTNVAIHSGSYPSACFLERYSAPIPGSKPAISNGRWRVEF